MSDLFEKISLPVLGLIAAGGMYAALTERWEPPVLTAAKQASCEIKLRNGFTQLLESGTESSESVRQINEILAALANSNKAVSEDTGFKKRELADRWPFLDKVTGYERGCPDHARARLLSLPVIPSLKNG